MAGGRERAAEEIYHRYKTGEGGTLGERAKKAASGGKAYDVFSGKEVPRGRMPFSRKPGDGPLAKAYRWYRDLIWDWMDKKGL